MSLGGLSNAVLSQLLVFAELVAGRIPTSGL